MWRLHLLFPISLFSDYGEMRTVLEIFMRLYTILFCKNCWSNQMMSVFSLFLNSTVWKFLKADSFFFCDVILTKMPIRCNSFPFLAFSSKGYWCLCNVRSTRQSYDFSDFTSPICIPGTNCLEFFSQALFNMQRLNSRKVRKRAIIV